MSMDCENEIEKENSNRRNNLEENIDSSKILSKSGRFQMQSLLLLGPGYGMVAMIVISHVFLNVTPDHICQQFSTNGVFNFSNKASESNETSCPRPYIFDDDKHQTTFENKTETDRSQCLEGWSYDLSSGNTVVSQFDLVCDAAWKRPLTISALMLGFLIASLFGGQVPDRFGRRKSSLAAFFIHTLIEAILSFSPSYWFYVVFLMLQGVALNFTYLGVYIWALELVPSSDMRSLAAFWMSFVFGAGGMMMSLVAYVVRDWDWIYRTLAIVGVVDFLLLCLVSESPTWLLRAGKVEEGQRVLKKIAAINKIDLDIKSISLKDSRKDKKSSKRNLHEANPMHLLRNIALLRRLVIICVLWFFGYLGYNTMTYNAANLGGNIYVDNLIGCAVDVGAVVLVTGMLKVLSRRNAIASLFGAVACFAVLSPFVKQANLIAGVAFAQMGRLCITGSTWLLLLYNGEIFPTLLRNTSVGFSSVTGRIGSILSPYLVFIGEEVDLSIPFFILGGISSISILLTLLLPDAQRNFLPDSLADALQLKDGISKLSCKHEEKEEVFVVEENKESHSSPKLSTRNFHKNDGFANTKHKL